MKKALLCLLVLLLLLTGCGPVKPVETPSDPSAASSEIPSESSSGVSSELPPSTFKFTTENYPKMGGSLACLPLGEAVTATVLGIDRETANGMISFAGSTTDNYAWLLDGTFDIILAYEPSEEAWKLINDDKVGVEMTAIGADGLVFIGSKDNPVTNLTREDVEKIYSGTLTDWSELGGKKEEIIPFQRNKTSGSQTLFDKLINLGDKLVEPPKEYRVETMIGLLEAVADYKGSSGALGYTVYYYLTNMEAGTLDTAKIFDFEGVTPSNETIASGEYALSNDFYVVIRKDAAADSPERVLYNWICSAQGKQLIERENYAAK